MEHVAIYHPDLPHTHTEPVTVTRRSFDETWSKPQLPHREKGWQLWDETVAEAFWANQKPPAKNAGRGDWVAYAEAVGIEVAPDEGRDAIIAKVSQQEE